MKKKNHFHGKIKDIFNFVLQLSTVTLSFFETLVGLNCEDVMLWLIFRHLIPQTAFLPSQRSAIRHPDIHGRGAEKLLQLTPICCLEAKTPGSLNGFNHMTSSPASHSGIFQKLVKDLIYFVFHEKCFLFRWSCFITNLFGWPWQAQCRGRFGCRCGLGGHGYSRPR